MHTTTLEGAHSRGESGRRFGPCTGSSAVQGITRYERCLTKPAGMLVMLSQFCTILGLFVSSVVTEEIEA